MILVKLFLAFLRVGSFSIGGAYSFLPLIEREVVERYQWLTKEEFLDVLGMSNVFPGAISVKYATYTGYKIAGIPGAVLANLGNLIVPSILVLFAFALYVKYKDAPAIKGALKMIELAVLAMIIAITCRMISFSQWLQLKTLLVVGIAMTLFLCTKIHPALIIIGAGLLGAFLK